MKLRVARKIVRRLQRFKSWKSGPYKADTVFRALWIELKDRVRRYSYVRDAGA